MHLKTVMVLSGCLLVALAAAPIYAQNPRGEIKAPEIELLEQKPKVIKRVDPIYPYNQAQAGVDGVVMMDFIINKEGLVEEAYVVESNNPAFERPALDAVLAWKFSPGIKDGKVVMVRARQKIEFSVNQGQSSSLWRITKGKKHSTLPPELQWDKAPVPVSTRFPVYPLAALQAETKGKTVLSFIVGPGGDVVQARVIEATTPEMGLAALAMIDAWRFEPAKKKDGTPGFAALGLEHEFNPSGFGDVPVTGTARSILRLLRNHPEKIIPSSQLDQPPKPISRRPPIYPVALNKAGQPGRAVIEFFIDDEGDAQLPSIVSSTAPEFGYAAVQAVSTWRFEPVKKDGKKVVTRVRAPIEFNQQAPRSTP